MLSCPFLEILPSAPQAAAGKAKGVYKGRKPSIDRQAVAALKAEGLGATEIAKRLGVGRASVYRLLEAAWG